MPLPRHAVVLTAGLGTVWHAAWAGIPLKAQTLVVGRKGLVTLSLKCPEPPDSNCQSRIADQIKSDRYIWGTLKKKGPAVSGEVHLWVRGKGTAKQSLDYASNLTEANDEARNLDALEAILTEGGSAVVTKARGEYAGVVEIDTVMDVVRKLRSEHEHDHETASVAAAVAEEPAR